MVARTPTMTVRTTQNEAAMRNGQETGFQTLSMTQGIILTNVQASSASI